MKHTGHLPSELAPLAAWESRLLLPLNGRSCVSAGFSVDEDWLQI
jgi:hypothetical protein